MHIGTRAPALLLWATSWIMVSGQLLEGLGYLSMQLGSSTWFLFNSQAPRTFQTSPSKYAIQTIDANKVKDERHNYVSSIIKRTPVVRISMYQP